MNAVVDCLSPEPFARREEANRGDEEESLDEASDSDDDCGVFPERCEVRYGPKLLVVLLGTMEV